MVKITSIFMFIVLVVLVVIAYFMLTKDDARNNPNVTNLWDCEEGCLYSDWIIHNRTNKTSPSILYKKCVYMCRNGFYESIEGI